MGVSDQGQQLERTNKEACPAAQSNGSDVDGTSTPDAKDAPAKCFNSDDEAAVDSSVQYSMGIRRHSGPKSYSWQGPVQTLPPMCCTLPNGGPKQHPQHQLSSPQHLLGTGKQYGPFSNSSHNHQLDRQHQMGPPRQDFPVSDSRQPPFKGPEPPRLQQQMQDFGFQGRSQGSNDRSSRPSRADQSPVPQGRGTAAGVLSPVAQSHRDVPNSSTGPRMQPQYAGSGKQLPAQGYEPYRDQNPRPVGTWNQGFSNNTGTKGSRDSGKPGGLQPQQQAPKLPFSKGKGPVVDANGMAGNRSSRNSSNSSGSRANQGNNSDRGSNPPSGAAAGTNRPQPLVLPDGGDSLPDVPPTSSKPMQTFSGPSSGQPAHLLHPMQVLREAGAHISSASSSTNHSSGSSSCSSNATASRGTAGTAAKAGQNCAVAGRQTMPNNQQQQQRQAQQIVGPTGQPGHKAAGPSSSSSTPTAASAAALQQAGPGWGALQPAPPPPPPPPPPRRQLQQIQQQQQHHVVLVPSQDIRKAPGTLVHLTAGPAGAKTPATTKTSPVAGGPKPSVTSAAAKPSPVSAAAAGTAGSVLSQPGVKSPTGIMPPAPPPGGPPAPPAPPAGQPPAAAVPMSSRDAGKEAGRQLLQQLQQPHKQQRQQQQHNGDKPNGPQQQLATVAPGRSMGVNGSQRPLGTGFQGPAGQVAGQQMPGPMSPVAQQQQGVGILAPQQQVQQQQQFGRAGPPSVSSSGPSSNGSSGSSSFHNRGRNGLGNIANGSSSVHSSSRDSDRPTQPGMGAPAAVDMPYAAGPNGVGRFGSAPPGISSNTGRGNSGPARGNGRPAGQSSNSSVDRQGSGGPPAAAAAPAGWPKGPNGSAAAAPAAVKSPPPTAAAASSTVKLVPAPARLQPVPAGAVDKQYNSSKIAAVPASVAAAQKAPGNSGPRVAAAVPAGASTAGPGPTAARGNQRQAVLTPKPEPAAVAVSKGKENSASFAVKQPPAAAVAVVKAAGAAAPEPVKPAAAVEVSRPSPGSTPSCAKVDAAKPSTAAAPQTTPAAITGPAQAKSSPAALASCLPEDEDDLLGITPSTSSKTNVINSVTVSQQGSTGAGDPGDAGTNLQQQGQGGGFTQQQQQGMLAAQPPPPPRKAGCVDSAAVAGRGAGNSVGSAGGGNLGMRAPYSNSMSPLLPQPGHRMVLSPEGVSPVWTPYNAGVMSQGPSISASAHPMGMSMPLGGPLAPSGPISSHTRQPIGSPAPVLPGVIIAANMHSPQMQHLQPQQYGASVPILVKPAPSKRLEIVDPRSRKGSSNQLDKPAAVGNGGKGAEDKAQGLRGSGSPGSSGGRSSSDDVGLSAGLLEV